MTGRGAARDGETRGGGPLVELVGRLRAMPARLAEVAVRATLESAGVWGPREAALHLAAVEELVWQARLRDLETHEAPEWTWTEPGVSSDARDDTLAAALELFTERRRATLALMAALSPAARSRAGTHATYGRLDLPALLAVAIDHDEHHLADLEALVPPPPAGAPNTDASLSGNRPA